MKECICGTELPEHARFCPNCGTPVVSEPEELPIAAEIPLMEEMPLEDFMPELPMEPETAEQPEDSGELLTDCGGIPYEEPLPEDAIQPKKRRGVLVPVIVMAVMLVVGTVCFFLLREDPAAIPEETKPSMQESIKETLPLPSSKDDTQRPGDNSNPSLRSDEFVPSSDDCFEITGEGLVFLAERYDGGAVLVIPEQIDGVPVTAIAPEGFINCQGVTTLILPDTLENIGASAFAGCADLRGIWLPDNVRSVGENAFRDCIGLEAVSVPAGTEYIGTDAFTGCAKLLYFFYDGMYEDWLELYNEYVTPFTSVTCQDGDYYHGVQFQ